MMMEEKRLLTVDCTSNDFPAVGHVSLYKISEVIYSVRYEDDERSISVDIDCVSVDVPKKLILFQEPLQTEYSFHVPDEKQLSYFVNLQKECQEVCNRYLEIATRLRDVYYSGVYTSLQQYDQQAQQNEQNPNRMMLNHELESLQSQTAYEIVEILKNRNVAQEFQQLANGQGGSNSLDAATTKPAKATTPRSAAGSVNGSVKSEASQSHAKAANENKCFYCNNEFQDLAATEDLYIHPYVPSVFDGSPILMCITCLQNWKEYRDTAQYENELILPDEVNEELCCLCSDSPETLTLCSSCPRSYCNGCLLKILSKKDYQRRIENSGPNWKCMACCTHTPEQPPLSRDAWQTWKGFQQQRQQQQQPSTSSSKPTISPLKLHRTTSGTSINSVGSTPRSSKKREIIDLDKEEKENGEDGSAEPRQVQTLNGTKRKQEKEAIESTEEEEEAMDQNKSSLTVDLSQDAMDEEPMKEDLLFSSEGNSESMAATNTRKSVGQSKPPGKSLLRDFIQKKVQEKEREKQKIETTPSNTRRGGGGRGSGRSRGKGRGSGKAANATDNPTTENNDHNAAATTSSSSSSSGAQGLESYYFQQYLDYEDNLYQEIQLILAKKLKKEVVTDDSCFLCKDGGNVVECDFVPARSQNIPVPFRRCLKVYHEECLGFSIPDDVSKWCCPRHYCSCCGDLKLKYICLFCPNSICEKCPSTFVERYGFARYCEVINPIPEPALKHLTSPVTPIVCEGCLEMIRNVQTANPDFQLKTIELGPEQQFPGTFNPNASVPSHPQKKRRKH